MLGHLKKCPFFVHYCTHWDNIFFNYFKCQTKIASLAAGTLQLWLKTEGRSVCNECGSGSSEGWFWARTDHSHQEEVLNLGHSSSQNGAHLVTHSSQQNTKHRDPHQRITHAEQLARLCPWWHVAKTWKDCPDFSPYFYFHVPILMALETQGSVNLHEFTGKF